LAPFDTVSKILEKTKEVEKEKSGEGGNESESDEFSKWPRSITGNQAAGFPGVNDKG